VNNKVSYMYLESMDLKETWLVVFTETSFDAKCTSNRGCKACTAEKRSTPHGPPLSLSQPRRRVKSTISKILGKEFLQGIRNLKFGIPQG